MFDISGSKILAHHKSCANLTFVGGLGQLRRKVETAVRLLEPPENTTGNVKNDLFDISGFKVGPEISNMVIFYVHCSVFLKEPESAFLVN